MPQVLFTQRSGPYWPGANPVLSDEKAADAIKSGLAVAYSDEARDKVRGLLAAGSVESVAIPAHTTAVPPQQSQSQRHAVQTRAAKEEK